MAESTRGTRERVDADGVRIRERTGVRGAVWLALAVIAVVGGALLLLPHRGDDSDLDAARRHDDPRDREAPRPGRVAAAAAVAPPGRPVVTPRPAEVLIPPRVDVQPASSGPSAPPPAAEAEPEPASQDPVFGASNPGERTGIALFPPPGTKPIKRGILVPEDFELPPGYVRHYQATDDGQRVPAILMFHPDYHPVDAHGDPIALPPDRVVPPDMAPPGMPIEMLQPPPEPSAEEAAP